MTLEEMQQKMRELENDTQEKFMHDFLERVENLTNKSGSKSYTPTTKEKDDFNKALSLLEKIKVRFSDN